MEVKFSLLCVLLQVFDLVLRFLIIPDMFESLQLSGRFNGALPEGEGPIALSSL